MSWNIIFESTNKITNIFRQIIMVTKVKLLANPQGIEAETKGKVGFISKRFFKFALIEFINEFGQEEEWYFENNEFVIL